MGSTVSNEPRKIIRFIKHLWDDYGPGSATRSPEEKAQITQIKKLAAQTTGPGDVWIFCWPPIGDSKFEEMFRGSVGHISAAVQVNGQLTQVLSQFPVESLPWAPNVMLSPGNTMKREIHVPPRPQGRPPVAFRVQVPNLAAFLKQAASERNARTWFMRPIYKNETNCVVSVHRSLTAAGLVYSDSQIVETPDNMQVHLHTQLLRAEQGGKAINISDATADIGQLYPTNPSPIKPAIATANKPSPVV